MNKAFKSKLNQYYSAVYKAEKLGREINEVIAEHLGDGWFIHSDPSDGIILVDEDSAQYRGWDMDTIFSLPKDEAIEHIKALRFN